MADNNPSNQELQYSLQEKNSLVIVSLTGSITKNSATILEKCQNEILEKNAKCAILNMQGVKSISGTAVPGFAKFQSDLRRRLSALAIYSLQPDLGKFLLNQVAIRSSEVFATMNEAIEHCRPYLS